VRYAEAGSKAAVLAHVRPASDHGQVVPAMVPWGASNHYNLRLLTVVGVHEMLALCTARGLPPACVGLPKPLRAHPCLIQMGRHGQDGGGAGGAFRRGGVCAKQCRVPAASGEAGRRVFLFAL
jgi:hypothetical protein